MTFKHGWISRRMQKSVDARTRPEVVNRCDSRFMTDFKTEFVTGHILITVFMTEFMMVFMKVSKVLDK